MSNKEIRLDNSEALKPLSRSDQIMLFIELKNGSILAREMLLKHNMRLVLREVHNKFMNNNYDKNDLVSIGKIGLIKAINTYDLKKKYEFSTYAVRCIDNEILMFIRKMNKEPFIESLDMTIDDNQRYKLSDTIESNVKLEEDYERKETIEIIKKFVQNLNNIEREIIKMSFGFYDNKTFTQQEIASKLNVSQSYVSKTIKRLLKEIEMKLYKVGIVEKLDNKKR